MNTDHLRQIIEIIIVAAIALVLATVAIAGMRSSKQSAEGTIQKAENISVMLSEDDFTKYDGAEVKGSDVIACISYFEGIGEPICIEVTHTGVNYIYTDESLTTVSTASLANARKKTSSEYINPNANFIGSIVRDSTDNSVRAIVFDIETP
jgi:hypothetical protein